jgi:hypothetical protein
MRVRRGIDRGQQPHCLDVVEVDLIFQYDHEAFPIQLDGKDRRRKC